VVASHGRARTQTKMGKHFWIRRTATLRTSLPLNTSICLGFRIKTSAPSRSACWTATSSKNRIQGGNNKTSKRRGKGTILRVFPLRNQKRGQSKAHCSTLRQLPRLPSSRSTGRAASTRLSPPAYTTGRTRRSTTANRNLLLKTHGPKRPMRGSLLPRFVGRTPQQQLPVVVNSGHQHLSLNRASCRARRTGKRRRLTTVSCLAAPTEPPTLAEPSAQR